MKKKNLTIILIIVILGAVAASLQITPAAREDRALSGNQSHFAQEVKAIRSDTVAFNDIVPFAWDTVYTFAPYTSKQEIEKIIGFESGHISETVSEGMTQLLFTKDDKVVADICGYPDNLGYDVVLSDEMIRHQDQAVFSVEQKDGIVLLTKIQ